MAFSIRDCRQLKEKRLAQIKSGSSVGEGSWVLQQRRLSNRRQKRILGRVLIAISHKCAEVRALIGQNRLITSRKQASTSTFSEFGDR